MSKTTVKARGSGTAAGDERQWRRSVTVEWYDGGQKVRSEEYHDAESLDRLIAELEAQGIETGDVEAARDRFVQLLAAQRGR